MRPSDASEGYVWDMLEAAREASSFVSGLTFEEYSVDLLRIRAVERSIQNLGEAAGRIDSAFRATHGEVPWKEITGQRNVLVHGYGEVDQRRIWAVATRDIHVLIPVLESILGKRS